MDDLQKINISISGWPGAGTTTLALILSDLTKRRYFHIGGVYRYLGIKLGFSDEGLSRPKFDDYIENIIGHTTDNFVDYKLLNDNNLIVGADIAVFRIGRHPKIFSIFLKASKENRIQRALSDNREDAILSLEQRDNVLKLKYKGLWDIEFFDEEIIQKKHSLFLDNSNMSLNNELIQVISSFKEFLQYKSIPVDYWQGIESKITQTVENYQKIGKEEFFAQLSKQKLIVEPQEIIQEITKLYPEDVGTYPEKIKNIFLGIN